MGEICLRTVVVASRRQVSCDLLDEVALLHLDSGVYYGLDPVGGRVWHLIREPARVADLRDRLLAEYEVEPGRCESDLLALLGRLAAEGLVEVKSEDAL